MNKKSLAIITVLLLISTCLGGVYAYLSDSDVENNRFLIGGCNVEIVEEFDPPEKLEPGTSFTKDVKVRNLGPSDCYVRIKAVFTDSSMGDYCTVDWNTTDFVYNPNDGYYYYKYPMGVGDITESLFTTVTISDSISPGEIKDFDILVYTEAYQSEGFDTYEEAWEHYHRNKPDVDIPDTPVVPEPTGVMMVPGVDFEATIPDTATSVVFTDEAAPEGVGLTNLAEDGSDGVVGWLDGTTYKVSTQQSGVYVLANPDSSKMFFDYLSNLTLKTIDLSYLDTSNTTNMSYMFNRFFVSAGEGDNGTYMGSITDITFGDRFITDNVTDMSYMFAYNTKLVEIDLNGFKTDKVTTMSGMFDICSSLETVILGSGFSFVGIDGYLPSTDDGNWYNAETGVAYAPSEIPDNTAATYVAVKPEVNVLGVGDSETSNSDEGTGDSEGTSEDETPGDGTNINGSSGEENNGSGSSEDGNGSGESGGNTDGEGGTDLGDSQGTEGGTPSE